MSAYPITRADRAREVPSLAGRLVGPGDQDYDQVRTAWNLAVDQRPAGVVRPESAATVTRLVPSRSTPNRGGACCATASSSSMTPASSCPAAARSPRIISPAPADRSLPESTSRQCAASSAAVTGEGLVSL